MESPFVFTHYRECLKNLLHAERGKISEFAKKLNCQPSYLSQVISGNVHLSLEHAAAISRFVEWNKEETRYFVLLVQRDRAGSKELEKIFQAEIDEIGKRNKLIKNRINVKQGINIEDQTRYYSSWLYAAVHVLITIPELADRNQIQEFLKLSRADFEPILSALVAMGLVEIDGNKLKAGKARIHLPGNSAQISKHQTNWKLRAIESCNRLRESDLHYSGVISVSKTDYEKIREIVLQSTVQIEQILRATKPEVPCVLNLDVFDLKSSL